MIDELAQADSRLDDDDPLPATRRIERRLPLGDHGANPLGRLPLR